MTAASRVLQLVATYTYITGSDKPAIKCTVLSTFRGFEDLRGRYLKKERKKGRKKKEVENERKREKRERLEKLLFSYFLWTRKRNRVLNVLENT